MEVGGVGWFNIWEFVLIFIGGNNIIDNVGKEGYKG